MGTNLYPYAVLEKDGTTLVELAPDEDTALMAAPKNGRIIQRDGLTRYVAKDGGWVWSPSHAVCE